MRPNRAFRLSALPFVIALSGCITIQQGASTPSGSPAASATATPVPASSQVSTPVATPTTAATVEPTPTEAPTPPPSVGAGQLNFSLPALYGSTALTSGFVPDPFSVNMTAGGGVSANYLGGGCYGNTTAEPSFSVNYTSGSAALLRFYFIGSGDTTMIINTPTGNFVCVDDSFGTLNPTLDFNSPSSGRYDVWVATYATGASISGTLYTTELSSNHP